MNEAVPQFTPVWLITGFLGSGKTTLLRRLLSDPMLADTAVLINEFGEIGLDHLLLERIDERTVLLQSGCLCCTIRGELSDALRDLHSKRARSVISSFRRVVIESTGLADPFPVLTTLHADPVLKHHYRMGSVVTTVDAVTAGRTLTEYPESVKQAAVADRLVLTKTDLASAEVAASVRRRLRAINPASPLTTAAETESLANALLADEGLETTARDAVAQLWFAEEMAVDRADSAPHDPDITAFICVLDRPIDWTVFGLWLTMLLHRHGQQILRVKGILNVAGTDAPVALHGVQQLVHPPVHLREWLDGDRRSRIVFIVKGLQRTAIEQSLSVFCRLGAIGSVTADATGPS